MDTFEQFQSYNDTISQYGHIADDTSSMISGYTNGTRRTDIRSQLDAASAFDKLSLAGDDDSSVLNGTNGHHNGARIDEDFDDGKGEDVDLPPHACR